MSDGRTKNPKDVKKLRPGGGRNKQTPLALVLMGKGPFRALKPAGASEKKGRRR